MTIPKAYLDLTYKDTKYSLINNNNSLKVDTAKHVKYFSGVILLCMCLSLCKGFVLRKLSVGRATRQQRKDV